MLVVVAGPCREYSCAPTSLLDSRINLTSGLVTPPTPAARRRGGPAHLAPSAAPGLRRAFRRALRRALSPLRAGDFRCSDTAVGAR